MVALFSIFAFKTSCGKSTLAQALAAQAERRHAAQVVARAMVARYNAAASGGQAAQPMRPEPAVVALQGRGHALDRIAAAMAG